MRILILDALPGRAPLVQKEGARLYRALKQIGHDVVLAGYGLSENLAAIPERAQDFDACLLCDNYPEAWPWSRFETIRIPKVFWAIDTHLRRFEFVVEQDFQIVLFNNYTHIDRFMSDGRWAGHLQSYAFFPYAIDPEFPADIEGEERFVIEEVASRDLVFCGSVDRRRKKKIRALEKKAHRSIDVLAGFGQDYINNILSGRINLNFPVKDDFNGRIPETLSLKRLLLSEHNANSIAVIPQDFGIFFHDLREARELIDRYLQDVEARSRLVDSLFGYVLKHHTYVARAEMLVGLLQDLVGPRRV